MMNCMSSNKVSSSGSHTHCLEGAHVHAEPKNDIRSEMMKIHQKVVENGDNSTIKREKEVQQ
jgi:hypothetical protein